MLSSRTLFSICAARQRNSLHLLIPNSHPSPLPPSTHDFAMSLPPRIQLWPHWHVCVLSHFGHVQLFATPWTVARQTPLSMGFSRQGYWSGLPYPSPKDLPDPDIEAPSPTGQGDKWPRPGRELVRGALVFTALLLLTLLMC